MCDDSLVTVPDRGPPTVTEPFLRLDTSSSSAIGIAARMASQSTSSISDQLVAITRSSKQVGYWTAKSQG